MQPSSVFGRRPDPSAPAPVAAPSEIVADGGGSDSMLAARRAWQALCVLSIPFGAYDAVWPSFLGAVALLATPIAIVIMAARWPDSFIIQTRGGPRPGIPYALAMPIAAMLCANLFHAQIDPWWPLIPAAILACVGVGVGLSAAANFCPDLRTLLQFALACGAYGYAAFAVVDIQFDSSAGSVIPAQVLGKHTTRNRHSYNYYLELPPWGPRTRPNNVEVTSTTYSALQIGDTVCMVLHPGALTLPWFTAKVCDGTTPAS